MLLEYLLDNTLNQNQSLSFLLYQRHLSNEAILNK